MAGLPPISKFYLGAEDSISDKVLPRFDPLSIEPEANPEHSSETKLKKLHAKQNITKQNIGAT